MKKISLLALVIMLVLLLTVCLASCNGSNTPSTPDEGNGSGDTDTPDNPSDGTQDEPTDGVDWDNTGLEGLALIYNGKARFRVVYTAEGGSRATRIANEFVSDLRKLGVDVADAVSDKNAEDVSECEIIIGSGARHRGEELGITDKDLGKNGFCVKTVGTKILIAGGTEEKLQYVFDYYKRNELGITNKTKEISSLAVDPAYNQITYTEYDISSVKIGKIDAKQFVVVEDLGDLDTEAVSIEKIKLFRDELYNVSGYWLDVVDASRADEYEHKIVFRYASDKTSMNEAGFAMYVDDAGNLIIECSYSNAFDSTYHKIMSGLIFDQYNSVVIPADYEKIVRVCEARYSDFGAVGDGKTNDFQAIYDTHVYANQSGQKVIGTEGAIYAVGPTLPKTIPVRTNVDWNGCTFLIDDTTSAAYQTRSVSLFTMDRDYPVVSLNEQQIDEIAGKDATLNFGDTSIPWLAPYIETKSLVMFTNTYHKDFIRHGANQTNGEPRKDVFIMYPDGSIDPETEVCFEFDEFTLVQIHRTDDAPITIENGNFINICCRTVMETDFMVKYHDYARGIKFERSNVTMKNVTHRMQDEPELNFNINLSAGGCNESYPYYAFVYTERTYNLLIEDCSLTGHTTYYQSGRATTSTGGAVSDPIPAGTYDIAVERSVDVHFLNTHQYAPTGLGDSRYWGIMTSNWTKDITFENCSINRFDAHRSFWGGKLINTEIGHTINLVGGGDLYMENVRKLVGNVFIQTRGDYGGTFRGDITLINCTLDGTGTYRSNTGGTYDPSSKNATGYIVNMGYSADGKNGYWDWFFGFESYMPSNMTIQNFTSGCTGYTYVYNSLGDDVFTAGKYPLHLAESVTFIDMKPLPICAGIEDLTEMSKIKVYTKKSDE